jgi:hypothetical protein
MVNRVAGIVSEEAKKNLVRFQDEHGLGTRDDALNELLISYPILEAKVKELEARIKELEAK